MFLGSCKRSPHLFYPTPIIQEESKHSMGRQLEAMLVDVPVPLYTRQLLIHSERSMHAQDIVVGYESTLSLGQLEDFYLNDMQRLGWRLIKLFAGQEIVLIFETPQRLCTIRLMAGPLQTTIIHLAVGKKDMACNNDQSLFVCNTLPITAL